MMKKILIAGGAAALVLSPLVAADEPPRRDPVARHVAVTYSDLNLARLADAETMLGRLERAARRACGRGVVDSAVPVVEHRLRRECARDATSRAVAELDAPLVTALYGVEPSFVSLTSASD